MIATAQIEISGATLPSRWRSGSVVALEDIAIEWGRSSIYDPASPATLSVTYLDPDGIWTSANAVSGKEIIVRRVGLPGQTDQIVFRGKITDPKLTWTEIKNPTPGASGPLAVWRVNIVATDVLADLATLVIDGGDRWNQSIGIASSEAPVGWLHEFNPDRLRKIWDKGLSRLLSAYSYGRTHPNPKVGVSFMSPIHDEDRMTVLDHLAIIYMQARTFGYVVYDPHGHQIIQGEALAGGRIELARAGSLVVLTVASGAGRALDASKIGVPDGYTIAADVSSAITYVTGTHHNHWGYKQGADSTQQQARVFPMYDPATSTTTTQIGAAGQRTRGIDMDLYLYAPTYQIAGQEWDHQRLAPMNLVRAMAEFCDAINGSLVYPRIRLYAEKMMQDPSRDYLPQIFAPLPSTIPLYLAGSIFNGLPAAPLLHQIIGGRLEYAARGWTHDVTLAPALSQPAPGGLTWDQLWGTSGATWAQLDPSIHLSDFAIVQKGL